MNRKLAIHAIEELIQVGVEEFVICPGGRNAPLAELIATSGLAHSFGYEERSSAFYALGIARKRRGPVAIVVTSGTAAGELLPAVMEAYYTSVPLILVTADRPRRYRGTNAPQTAEQPGLYGVYCPTQIDVEGDERFSLGKWNLLSPVHLNICFEEPAVEEAPHCFPSPQKKEAGLPVASLKEWDAFQHNLKRPLAIVSTLAQKDRAQVIDFLEKWNAPVYIEGVSGIRTEKRLETLRVTHPRLSAHDGVLRIGGVPTHRIWRDLEDAKGNIKVLSITEHPFSGLSLRPYVHTDISQFLKGLPLSNEWEIDTAFYENERSLYFALQEIMAEEPCAEPSLVFRLSQIIPEKSLFYLGNSLPIRLWDLTADYNGPELDIQASRGLNGIDGQLACFLGLAEKNQKNFALVGDLTALYDFAAGWFWQQIPESAVIFVMNNRGGRIFSRRFKNQLFQHPHDLEFEHFAKFWKMPYQRWEEISEIAPPAGLIEIVPDAAATVRFFEKWDMAVKGGILCLK